MAWNSVPPHLQSSLSELRETIGTTQFSGVNADEWAQVIGGLIIQGGKVTVPDGGTLTVNFPAPYPKQVLGVFPQVISNAVVPGWSITVPDLNTFVIYNPVGADREYYWWAVGV